MTKINLNKQAQEIIKLAEESGVESNFFFITTFNRYRVQLEMLQRLEKMLKTDEILVTKEYIKGRKNVYCNPIIKDYNSTTDSANKTVNTLMKILKNYGVSGNKEDTDPLFDIINGRQSNDG